MTRTVIPRPVAWTLSENEGGGFNLAPFSYFNALCSAPPLLGVSFAAGEGGGAKDTLKNIRRQKEFVVHIAPMKMLDALNESSAPLPYGESEVSRLGLATASFSDDNGGGDGDRLPRLRDCPLAFLCELSREISLHEEGAAEQFLVLGKIRKLYAAETVLAADAKGRQTVSAECADPVARLSAGNYAGIANFQSRRRPVK